MWRAVHTGFPSGQFFLPIATWVDAFYFDGPGLATASVHLHFWYARDDSLVAR